MTTKAQPAALSGPMTLRAHIALPPTERPFLKRVLLDGSFHIRDARFNRPQTQQKVNELSSRARQGGDGDKSKGPSEAAEVVSELSGSARLRNGITQLSDLRFTIPRAIARGGGTYNVVSHDINLQGTVAMAATVSEASKGWKSVVIKPFNKLFGRPGKRGGAELPVHVTGRYPRPRFDVSLVGKKRRG